LLISFVSVKTPKLTHTNECLKKHAFFAKIFGPLEANKKVLEKPQVQSNTKCGEEWALYGTCCNIADIEAVARSDSANIRHKRRDLIDSVEQLAAITQNIINKWKRIQDIKEDRAIASNPTEFNSFLKSEMDPIEQVLTEINTNSFESKITKCTEEIIRVRSNSLCPLCSGRSDTFFIPGDKRVLITEDTCKAYLESCVDPLSSSSDLFIYLDKLSVLYLRHVQQKYLRFWRPFVSGIRAPLIRFNSMKFIKDLRNYIMSDPNDNSKETSALCYELVSLAGPTWINTMLHNFKEVTKAFNSFLEQLDQSFRNTLNTKWTAETRSRRLQQEDSGPEDKNEKVALIKVDILDFHGDVRMFQKDFHVSSKDVTAVSQHETKLEGLNPLPIDLRLKFP
jgi:6-pyruvoyl-tetrahydropterin synthase